MEGARNTRPHSLGSKGSLPWMALTLSRSEHPEGPGCFSGENKGVFHRFEVDVEQAGVFKQPVIVQGRDENSLFPEGRNKGIDFSLQNHRFPQIQRSALSIKTFETEESGQYERRSTATSQNSDRDVSKSLNEANAVNDARGSVYDSGELTTESVQHPTFHCTQSDILLSSFFSPYVHPGLNVFVQKPIC